MTDTFKRIFASARVNSFTSTNPFRIILHNGDNDLVCDFMEAEYFVENMSATLNGAVSFKNYLNQTVNNNFSLLTYVNHGAHICQAAGQAT